MRICFLFICCAMVVLQLSACKTPVLAGTDVAANAAATQHTAGAGDVATSADSTAGKATAMPPSIISIILNAHSKGGDMVLEIGSVSVKEGYFKRGYTSMEPNYLKAYFTDDAGTRLDSNHFENPLKRRMEYPSEQGGLATKMVTNAEGAAYLRANYNAAITTLTIYSADNKKITSFHINDYLKQ